MSLLQSDYQAPLAAVATSGSYNDLINEPTNLSASSGSSTVSLCTRGEKYTWNNKSDVKTSASAASGGTTLSLCTTGEKYTWNNKSNVLTTEKVTIAASAISANSVKDFTASVAKSGYTPLGIIMVEVSGGGNYVVLVNFLISGTTGRVRLCNTSSSAFTPTSVDITVLYVKN